MKNYSRRFVEKRKLFVPKQNNDGKREAALTLSHTTPISEVEPKAIATYLILVHRPCSDRERSDHFSRRSGAWMRIVLPARRSAIVRAGHCLEVNSSEYPRRGEHPADAQRAEERGGKGMRADKGEFTLENFE